MPLINLLSDPTAFKYNSKTRSFGGDRPGNGDSGLPYVKFPVGGQTNEEKFKKFFSMNSTGLDYPIRGGSIVTDPMSNTSIHAQIDKERISKFFEDKPRGDAFLKKQMGLQLSNPKVQTGETIFLQRLGYIPGPIENTRVYNNGKNTLAQVAAAGTGINLRRAGTMPFGINDKFYQDVVGAELSLTAEEVQNNNRLLILTDLKMKQRSTGAEVDLKSVTKNINKINSLGISLNREILFQYLGGPGSVYGVGSTTIKRSKSSDTTEAVNYKQTRNFTMPGSVMTYDDIRNRSLSSFSGSLLTGYEDFRGESAPPQSRWTNDNKIDVRFFDGRVDAMNASTSSIRFKDEDNPWYSETNDGRDDMIKFLFETIEYDGEDKLLFFRAHLSSITDNNTGQWNAFKYAGRGENFYTYSGFERTISFSFKIALMSNEELAPVYYKLNKLMGQVYPDYSKNGYMRAPLVRLTIGDYIYRLPGFLTNASVTMDQNTPWNIDEGEQLPHVVDVQIGFTPILNNLPQRRSRLIYPTGKINDSRVIVGNASITRPIGE